MEADIVDKMWGDASKNTSIIKVIGVGGGGGNAVDHMYRLGIKDVGFVVCNTDTQALNSSPVPVKVQLGKKVTEGLGAGSEPEQGRMAAEENLNEIAELMRSNTKMVFITAGMGGGTGTGAAPVIAKVAKDMGILTVAIVTIPFVSMEPLRVETAYSGIRELRKYVDSLLVIQNEKLLELYSDLFFSDAFAKADEVLCTAVKGIAEIITISARINMDFADVRTTMKDSGVTLIGIGRCSGQNRAEEAVNQAINSPLLNNNSIRGAKKVLVNIMMGEKELKVSEIKQINDIVLNEVGDRSKLHIKTGVGKNPQLGEDITVSIIATGFEVDDIGITDPAIAQAPHRAPQPPLHVDPPTKSPQRPQAEKPWDPFAKIVRDEEDEEEIWSGRGSVGSNPQPKEVGARGIKPQTPISGSHVPVLLNKDIPEEVLVRPIRSTKRRSSSHSDGEVSQLSFVGDKWEQTSVSYIEGKPD
ncbi:MAG: cell division protein FtsZ [Prevotellaceae bacterium]|jgi:cell division protein FtsZ|nr:cell division protein FtsZ [Prevotellaceae bacterium]